MAKTDSSVLKYIKRSPTAITPSRGSAEAAGVDLHSDGEYTVEPRGKVFVDTGLVFGLPDGCYGRVAPRSGLAAKHSIAIGAGVIDRDYRGTLSVILFNHSDQPYHVHHGDRIAQLICEKIAMPTLEQVDDLGPTGRGAGAFGSTGR